MDNDTKFSSIEDKIDELKNKIDNKTSSNGTSNSTPANVANFLSTRLDDVFSSNRFKKLENLEPELNSKIEEFELKLKEIKDKDESEHNYVK
jgi:uncharacterized protein YdcH (DUF465 family)